MVIDSFTGDYFFLSNFFYPCPTLYDFDVYPSSEHAYQAAKSKDPEVRNQIKGCATCREAKKMGRKIKLRPNWDAMKIDVMEKVLRSKFSTYGYRQADLLRTGSAELIEGNDWNDTFWGMVKENGIWVGENHLGKLLMKIRDERRNEQQEVSATINEFLTGK